MLLTGPEALKALTTAHETGRALPGFAANNRQPTNGPAARTPHTLFARNIGRNTALADALAQLRSAA